MPTSAWRLPVAAAALITASLTIAAQRPAAPASLGLRRRAGADPLLAADANQSHATSSSSQVAWTYDTGEPGALQTQPVVVGDVLYGYTPTHKTFAVNAATGAHLWTFDSGHQGQRPEPRRDVSGRAASERRVFAAVDNFVYALDAATGKPIASRSARGGRIDLRENLGRDPATQGVRLTSPGVIYKDLMIVGGRVGEGLPTSPGDIRAYDVRTRRAAVVVPHDSASGRARLRDVAEAGLEYSGGANSWPGMALDERTRHRLRADRIGGDRFLRRRSARRQPVRELADRARRRHRQARLALPVRPPRHLGSRPAVAAEPRDGPAQRPRRSTPSRRRPSTGYVFLFDRANGEPLFPIEYRTFPASTRAGRSREREQPMPAKPAPFARQLLTERSADEAHA